MSRATSVWAADAKKVQAHHASLWRAHWQPSAGHPPSAQFQAALGRSLASLAEQGYGQSEAAVMFGVSRERIRQWSARFGLDGAFKALGKGTKPRVWDANKRMFVARTRDTERRDQRTIAIKVKRKEQRGAATAERVWLIVGLRELAAELGRVPTSKEVARAFGFHPLSYGSLAVRFSGRSRYRRAADGEPTPYADMWRRWFRLAGLTPRGIGALGHLSRTETPA